MTERRETVMLAHSYDPYKHRYLNIKDWYVSIKLDGMRIIWDGGISLGIPCSEVPWANTSKHHIRKCEVLASGMWTRLFQPVNAPISFLESLPPYPLDGEIYAGIGNFQKTVSICKKYLANEHEWKDIKYHI